MSKSPKPLNMVSLRLGGGRGKTYKTSYYKWDTFLQLNIIIKRIVHDSDMRVLLLLVVRHKYGGDGSKGAVVCGGWRIYWVCNRDVILINLTEE